MNQQTRKGQAATEMLVTIGIILIFVVPILLLLLVGAQARFESLSHVQASSVVRIIADSINEVNIEGPQASKVIMVNIPTNAQYINITENEVVIRLETSSGPTDVATSFFGELNQSSVGLVTNENGVAPSGLYPMKFHAMDNGEVVIEHGG
ncbi:hypothetical protein GF412_04375 [Candidatus Micrarchaeota archaeon]|nr:hypothetical protein [Candidatus Micrarchaeota archaeon]MBD3418187.1 hypothetical protein [Candidatus Micrarchaeota archaeon]